MLYLIYLLVGIVIGMFISICIFIAYIINNTYGKIKSARDDGETYLFLELKDNPEVFMSKKYAIFKIDGSYKTSQD